MTLPSQGPSATGADFQLRAQRSRRVGITLLALGLVAAGGVYWLEPREPDDSDDPGMTSYSRSVDRQMGNLYGQSGQLIEDLNRSLKQPGTQAILILTVAGVIAAGCFRFARVLADRSREAAADPAQDTPQE